MCCITIHTNQQQSSLNLQICFVFVKQHVELADACNYLFKTTIPSGLLVVLYSNTKVPSMLLFIRFCVLLFITMV
jgi:hypothetical protein